VLITGGTGGLGALLARHLATAHGARRLLLASRSGEAAAGASELKGELAELGCDVRIAACDVSKRADLERLLASVPAEHPLGLVLHTAGVLDDGVIESLDGERLARAMAPKVDAAVNLHELVGSAAELVLFSSVAASLGSPGQGNYAAANSFLDALAHHRRAAGLPGVSLAWGAWERTGSGVTGSATGGGMIGGGATGGGMTGGGATGGGMAGTLGETDRARLARMGIGSLAEEHGLELFDLARTLDAPPLLVPVRLEMAALRAQAKAGTLPAVMRGLIRAQTRRASDARGSLARKLAGSPQSEWDGIVMELVRGHVAGVLGHASAESIEPGRAFKELGFDSLAAVELRNRLSRASGLKLPSTLIFDHPTPAAVAEHVRRRISPDAAAADRDPREAEIRQTIASLPIARLRSAGLLDLLLALADADSSAASDTSAAGAAGGEQGEEASSIGSMDAQSLIERALEIGGVESRA
jgi:polyketide synthase 12